MSAIAGIIRFDGAPVEKSWVEGLTGAMESRAVDGRAHWLEGPVALGHCMHRCTPESLNEVQPLISSDGRFALVFDGRLDNRGELMRKLESPRTDGGLPGDPELVLDAFRKWGEGCPDHLLGDFAIAVWDRQEHRAFCARDHVGGRPFYFVKHRDFFAFASSDEALPCLPGITSEPNEEYIAHFLVRAFQDIAPRSTWLKAVSVLSPAHILSVDAESRMYTRRYWKCEPKEASGLNSQADYEEAFLDVFFEAVRCRARVAGTPVAMISGGMDSAAIAATLGRLSSELETVCFTPTR